MSTQNGTSHRGGQARELLALGMSHKTAPVALRERLAFSEAEAVQFAEHAIASPEVSEAVVISTEIP